MSNIRNICKMVTVYKGFTIVLNPFSTPQSWLVYLGSEFIAKVTWLPDAWALIDARLAHKENATATDAYHENIEVFNVLNDNFDGDWTAVLTANLYNQNGECLGTLRNLHFVYDTENDKFEGSW